jgi:S-adenosylmethionine-dependent methyltransferase
MAKEIIMHNELDKSIKSRKGKKTVVRGSFDGIASKFDKNIYGTTKGKLRHQLLVHHLSEFIEHGAGQESVKNDVTTQKKPVMNVLDVGGGTGIMALEFARQGHAVHLIDISEDALTVASQKLQAYPQVIVELASVDAIQGEYDFIVCHALLEWLDEPLEALNRLITHLAPGGVMSLSFFNKNAKVFNNLLYGNFDYVSAGLPKRNTVRLNPHNAQQPNIVIDFLSEIDDIDIIKSNGIRCIHDYMTDKTRIDPQYQKLFELELKYGALEPYKWLGKYFHILLTKKSVTP